MADPAYIGADGVLTDGEAWISLSTTKMTGTTASLTLTDPADGSSKDWCQFMDLVVIWYARSNGSGTDDRMQIRLGDGSGLDTGNNYNYQKFRGDGSSVTTGSGMYSSFLGGNFPKTSATTYAFGGSVTEFLDINSGKYKSCIIKTAANRSGAGYVNHNSGAWFKESAIKQIQFFPDSGGSFLAGSMFSLFGVLPRMVTV